MSTLYGCECPHPTPVSYRRGPLPSPWRVYNRNCNYSAFNGYHCTPSDYSALVCLQCNRVWRSKGSYVMRVPDITDHERHCWFQRLPYPFSTPQPPTQGVCHAHE